MKNRKGPKFKKDGTPKQSGGKRAGSGQPAKRPTKTLSIRIWDNNELRTKVKDFAKNEEERMRSFEL